MLGSIEGVVFLDRILLLLSPPVCAACDAALRRDAVFCAPCHGTLEPPPALPAGVTAACAYGGAVADAVRRLKFQKRVDLMRPLRRLIVENLPCPDDIDLVAPVSAHVNRLRARGFDPAALLARAVAAALNRPLEVELLTRVVDTPHLSSLTAEDRPEAVRGAFVARPVDDLHVLLVDDVRTTGATLEAASHALRGQGATVRSHVLAATPLG